MYSKKCFQLFNASFESKFKSYRHYQEIVVADRVKENKILQDVCAVTRYSSSAWPPVKLLNHPPVSWQLSTRSWALYPVLWGQPAFSTWGCRACEKEKNRRTVWKKGLRAWLTQCESTPSLQAVRAAHAASHILFLFWGVKFTGSSWKTSIITERAAERLSPVLWTDDTPRCFLICQFMRRKF